MELKWFAIIAAWFAVATAVTASAFAWGPEGRGTVLVMAGVGFLVAGIVTGAMAAGGHQAVEPVEPVGGDHG